MLSSKSILICPLNWGLGHATRCIPIIRLLLKKNAEVIIAADGRPLELLKQEFPQLECIELKGYDITYPQRGSMVFKIFFSIPKILFGIYSEHKKLKQIISEKKINVVISDNRFGLWNKEIRSIFITHQLMIKTPFSEKHLHKINLSFIKKYDECWIPDVSENVNLSGDLSHKYALPENTFFIGWLSRFNADVRAAMQPKNYKYDVMAIISGPEPQRSIFEKIILLQIQKTNLKAIIICGKTEINQSKETIGNIELVSHLNAEKMQQTILASKIIIARSGYSTLMDLATLRKKAIFIPTPGQTEQEYLAERLMQNKIAFYQTQSDFNLENALKESIYYKGFENVLSSTKLEKRIENSLS